jgi:hypothetical protein
MRISKNSDVGAQWTVEEHLDQMIASVRRSVSELEHAVAALTDSNQPVKAPKHPHEHVAQRHGCTATRSGPTHGPSDS